MIKGPPACIQGHRRVASRQHGRNARRAAQSQTCATHARRIARNTVATTQLTKCTTASLATTLEKPRRFFIHPRPPRSKTTQLRERPPQYRGTGVQFVVVRPKAVEGLCGSVPGTGHIGRFPPGRGGVAGTECARGWLRVIARNEGRRRSDPGSRRRGCTGKCEPQPGYKIKSVRHRGPPNQLHYDKRISSIAPHMSRRMRISSGVRKSIPVSELRC